MITIAKNAAIFAHLVAIDAHYNDILILQRANKELVLPLLKGVRIIKSHAADRRRLLPVENWLLGSLDNAALRFRDLHPAVVDPPGGNRPAVIFTFFRHVDLIPAARAVLIQPQRLAPRVDRHPLRVADAVRPDLRPRTLFACKRVILRHLTLIRQPHQLALQLIQILRRRALIVFTQRYPQITFAIKHHPATKMVTGREFWLLAENGLELLQLFTIVTQATKADGGSRFAILPRFGVAQPYAP